jgi:ABC-type nitrate/sulfonate/bicarbonate transport system substrate-binding protein
MFPHLTGNKYIMSFGYAMSGAYMQKKILAIIGILLVFGVAIIFGAGYLQGSPQKYSGPPESITIGVIPSEYSTLIWIAEDQHFFSDNGLNVTLKEYSTGASSLNALSTHIVNFSLSSEYAVITQILQGADIRPIVAIDKAENEYLIGRKDKGISNISDLKGKKIGVLRKGAAEFYLGRYLNLHGINLDEVTLVNEQFAQSVISMNNGTIDATLLPEPHAFIIQNNLGDNAIVWPAQSGQLLFMTISSTPDTINKNPELITRLLRSLYQAEQFALANPNEAKAIVQKKMKYDPAYMEKIWPEHRFTLSLDQSLILAMEDETRWMMKNNLTDKTVMPNYLDYLYTDSLRTVNPASVNIIR